MPSQFELHEKALRRCVERDGGRDDQRITARFEEARKVAGCDLGASPLGDASLNWNGGEIRTTKASGDKPFTQEQAIIAGVGSAEGTKAEQANPAPKEPSEETSKRVGNAKSGVRAILSYSEGKE